MSVTITSVYNMAQVVDAAERGDQCYEGKRGFWWHHLDRLSGINTDTLHGPFETNAAAWADMEAGRALYVRVAEDIDNAKANGHDVLPVLTNQEVAEDMVEQLGYEGVDIRAVTKAVAAVRGDRA